MYCDGVWYGVCVCVYVCMVDVYCFMVVWVSCGSYIDGV